jgi:hypothetical protein
VSLVTFFSERLTRNIRPLKPNISIISFEC